VAPVIVYQQADAEFKGWYLENLFGNLWRRQEWEIHAPTRVGQVLRCSARVADRYRRRDRDVVAQEMFTAAIRDRFGSKMPKGTAYTFTAGAELPAAKAYDLVIDLRKLKALRAP